MFEGFYQAFEQRGLCKEAAFVSLVKVAETREKMQEDVLMHALNLHFGVDPLLKSSAGPPANPNVPQNGGTIRTMEDYYKARPLTRPVSTYPDSFQPWAGTRAVSDTGELLLRKAIAAHQSGMSEAELTPFSDNILAMSRNNRWSSEGQKYMMDLSDYFNNPGVTDKTRWADTFGGQEVNGADVSTVGHFLKSHGFVRNQQTGQVEQAGGQAGGQGPAGSWGQSPLMWAIPAITTLLGGSMGGGGMGSVMTGGLSGIAGLLIMNWLKTGKFGFPPELMQLFSSLTGGGQQQPQG